jgi:xanthine dehydrogenase YagS FAD-binding subunit
MVALDASMVVDSVDGQRVVTAEKFFRGPDTHITTMTSLRPGEVLTAIRIPSTWAGARFYFEKVADRDAWDFALVSIASAMRVQDGAIGDSRIVCGGVACTPHRLRQVENALAGRNLSDETADLVSPLASEGAKALNYNHFKLPLLENLLRRAVRA